MMGWRWGLEEPDLTIQHAVHGPYCLSSVESHCNIGACKTYHYLEGQGDLVSRSIRVIAMALYGL